MCVFVLLPINRFGGLVAGASQHSDGGCHAWALATSLIKMGLFGQAGIGSNEGREEGAVVRRSVKLG